MITPNLTENMECVGEFYINDDKKISGSLKFVDGQIRLHLLNSSILSLPKQMSSNDPPLEVPLISGNTDRGKVTIIDTWFGFPIFIGATRGTALYAIFGASNLFEITNLTIKFDVLKQWAFPKGGYNIPKGKFLPELEKDTFLIDDIECSLNISLSASTHVLEGKRISHIVWFDLKSKTPKNIRKYMEIFQALRSFLQIITGRNVKPIEMHTSIVKHEYPVYLPLDKSDPYGSDLDHIINFTPELYNWGNVFEKWFAFHTRNEYMILLFLESMEIQIIKKLDFFALASILEGLYKTTYQSTEVNGRTVYPDKRYVDRIKRLLNDVFKDHFDNLTQFINTVDEFRHNNFHLNIRKRVDTKKLAYLTIDLHHIIRYIFLHQSGLDVIGLLNHNYHQNWKILKKELCKTSNMTK